MSDVSVVMVTYNAAEWVQRSLKALRTYQTDLVLQLVVLDNASTDFTSAELRAWAGPGAIVHNSATNIGFARGCNAAVAMSDGCFVLLLNPDAVIEPGTIEALVEHHRSAKSVRLVGGQVLLPSGEIDPGSTLTFQTTASLVAFATGLSTLLTHRRSRGKALRLRTQTARQVDVIAGCLLLIDREMWDALDGFDGRFFMYGEDVDLCRRALTLGGEAWLTPTAQVVHALGASSGTTLSKQIMLFRGKATLARKHDSVIHSRLHIGLLTIGVGIRAAGERALSQDRSAWLGLWHARKQWTGGWPPVHDTVEVGA